MSFAGAKIPAFLDGSVSPRISFRRVATFLAIVAVYGLAARLGLGLASIHASISPVWPPTGLALAILLLIGRGFWPAIALGAFLTNLATSGSPLASSAIAIGNTLEAIAGAWLVQRFAGGVEAFDRPRDVFRFALLAGVLATMISATIGVAGLSAADLLARAQVFPAWLTWWLGDMAGALLVTPAILAWARGPSTRWRRARVLEVAALTAVLLALAWFLFAESSPGERYPLEFLCILPLIWAAFRFGPRETVTAGLLLSTIAIVATLGGRGPFHLESENASLLCLQIFMAGTLVTTLAIQASVLSRDQAEARARRLNEELERLVAQRTSQLQRSNQELTREVGERRQAEQALRESEERLKAALHITHVGSWSWDIDKNHLWWSEELYRIFGVDPSTFTRSYQGFLDCVHPDDRARVRGVIDAALRDRQPFSFEHRILRLDGSVRTLSVQGTVMVDAGGRTLSILGTSQDITERKRAEEEREQLLREQEARRQAEEANRAKDDFLAVLSHELRTPLNAIVGWAELLKDGRLDPENAKKAVETILRNGRVQTQLISDILDVSRIVSGTIALEPREVDLNEVAQAAADSVRPSASAKGVRVELRLDPAPQPVRGDPFRLQQIVWNLLSNAIKFAPDQTGSVQLRTQAQGQRVRLTVTDDGPGIDPAFLPHVFERFRQADSSTTRPQGGLGLGLAIVSHLVEMHQGTVRAQNRPDRSGALLTVELPRIPATPQPPGPRIESPPQASIEGLRILIVDDEPDSLHLMRVLLESFGTRVRSADSASAALTALERELPDIVLTDIAMPLEDGYSLLRRIRALPPDRGGRLPVAAITAYASAADKHKLRHAGFQGHLTKPFQVAALRQLVVSLSGAVTRPV